MNFVDGDLIQGNCSDCLNYGGGGAGAERIAIAAHPILGSQAFVLLYKVYATNVGVYHHSYVGVYHQVA